VHLQVYYLPCRSILKVIAKEMVEGVETLDQALVIVEAIDPDDEEAAAEACHTSPSPGRPHVRRASRWNARGSDADREISDPRLLPAHAYGRLLAGDFEYSQFSLA